MWLELSVAVLQSPFVSATVVIWPLFFFFDVNVALSAAAEAATADVLVKSAADGSERVS